MLLGTNQQIRLQKFKWAGHICRMNDNKWKNIVTEWEKKKRKTKETLGERTRAGQWPTMVEEGKGKKDMERAGGGLRQRGDFYRNRT
ncbi:jg26704 [Pararge aegeria aegeria]|uniref:Jg26704 protein n=1 Tax=Pararge aegeria aegeria TaxID=348720 RepID=A0A8S4QUT2_9NEOP|nr:jg26704 [Pararge aegeria aegeria]